MNFSARVKALAVAALLVVACPIAWPAPAVAHRDGCHRWHSCPSDTGSYICGDTGHFSECGVASLPEEPDEPVADYDPPSRPAISEPKTRARGQVAVTVTAEAGSNLVVTSGGKTVYERTATGGRQVVVFKGLDGTHQYSVQATDSSDNTSSVAKFKVTADGVAPSVEGAAITTGTSENAYTQVTFAPGEAAGYAIAVDGRRVIAGKADGGDEQVGFPVGNGHHRIVLKLADTVGNINTFEHEVDVEIASLTPAIEAVTRSNEGTRRFRIVGTPGSRGILSVAGQRLPVSLETDSADVSVELPDGDYAAGSLAIEDQVGRTGSVAIPAFTIDTTSPLLKVRRIDDNSTTGRLAAHVKAEEGARVVWRILDEAGELVQRAKYIATGDVQTVDVDVEEGTATLQVEATDAADNTATDEFEAPIEADPLGVIEWLIFVVVIGLVLGAGLLTWRRRHAIKGLVASQRRALEVRRARRAHDLALRHHAQLLQQHATLVADHLSREEAWRLRKKYLTQLHEESQFEDGSEPAVRELLGVKVKTGERVYSVVDGALLEERTRQNVPTLVEVERGRVAVTNLRVLFLGSSKKREWAYDKVESMTEVGGDATLLRVSNRKTLSGVVYGDPERTRLHLALALHASYKDRQGIINRAATVLRNHENSRPVEPPPAPHAPRPPAILLDEAEELAARAH